MKELAGVRINQVAVSHIIIDPSEEMNTIQVVVNLMDGKANETVAYMKPPGIWSRDTVDAASKLIQCIEADVAGHLSGGSIRDNSIDGTGTEGGIFGKED